MKPIALALVSILAGLGTSTVRADQNRVSVGVGLRVVASDVAANRAAPVPAYFPAPARSFGPAYGHWDEVIVKTWVPDRWVVGRDRWGRPYRFLEKGYFVYRTERVWVDGSRGGAYSYNGGPRAGRNG